MASHKLTAEEWPVVCEEYAQGLTISKLCHKFHCSQTQIKSILRSGGVEIRKSPVGSKIVDPTPEEIIERAAEARRNTLLAMADIDADEREYLEYEAACRGTDVATIYMEELAAEQRVLQKTLSREELQALARDCKPDERHLGVDDNPFE